jgi:hypothetical protein
MISGTGKTAALKRLSKTKVQNIIVQLSPEGLAQIRF